jgi:hypothetical protein
MRRLLALACLCVLVFTAPALAGPGVNLRWDQCFSDNGVQNKTFVCDSNTGSERLVMSMEIAAPVDSVSGLEPTLDIGFAAPILPAWWQFKIAGSCRQGSLTITASLPPGATNCADWSAGTAQGTSIAAYQVGIFGPSTARILTVTAVPAPSSLHLDPGVEYFVGSLVISHARTVGTGSCGGCDVPGCLFFSQVRVDFPSAARDFGLEQGANGPGSQYSTWQNGSPMNIQHICNDPPRTSCYTTFNCVLATPTQNRGSTWGSVKSLYR